MTALEQGTQNRIGRLFYYGKKPLHQKKLHVYVNDKLRVGQESKKKI